MYPYMYMYMYPYMYMYIHTCTCVSSLHLIPLINNIYDYSVLKRERRRKAILILTHLFQMNSKKTSFSAWFTDTTESKKAKVFFQVLLLVTYFKFDQTFTFRPFCHFVQEVNEIWYLIITIM